MPDLMTSAADTIRARIAELNAEIKVKIMLRDELEILVATLPAAEPEAVKAKRAKPGSVQKIVMFITELAARGLTIEDIASEAPGTDPSSIRSACHALVKAGQLQVNGDIYSLPDQPARSQAAE